MLFGDLLERYFYIVWEAGWVDVNFLTWVGMVCTARPGVAIKHRLFQEYIIEQQRQLGRTMSRDEQLRLARRIGAFFRDQSDRLAWYQMDLACDPHETPDEFFQRQEAAYLTLGTMYWVSLAPDADSSSTLLLLALRYALDPLTPLEGNSSRFRYRHVGGAWQIEAYATVADAAVGSAPVLTREVHDAYRRRVLSCVLRHPRRLAELRSLVTLVTGGPPTLEQCLPVEQFADIGYQVVKDPKVFGGLRVDVWLDGVQVAYLTNQRAVHALLRTISLPGYSPMTQKVMGRKLRIANVSQAIQTIGKALETTRGGGGSLLLPNPVRWALHAHVHLWQPEPGGEVRQTG